MKELKRLPFDEALLHALDVLNLMQSKMEGVFSPYDCKAVQRTRSILAAVIVENEEKTNSISV